jgi:hypothetical protein
MPLLSFQTRFSIQMANAANVTQSYQNFGNALAVVSELCKRLHRLAPLHLTLAEFAEDLSIM